MHKMREIRGVIPVLDTPFLQDGEIDETGLGRLVEFLLGQKIGGLWVLGTGSEDMNMSFKKRLRVAEIVSEVVAGQTPIVVGAGFFALDDTMEFLDKTAHLDFDAYHVMPYHPLYSLDRLEWHYRYVADRCPKPLFMYTSANWCRPVPPSFVGRLIEHPNIAGIKFSSSKAPDNLKVIAQQNDEFQVITAVATQLYPCLCMGSRAHTSSLGSAVPELLIDVYEHFMEGRHEQALAAQRRLTAFLGELPKTLGEDNFIKAADEKYILSLRGICELYTSSYYRDANAQEQAQVRETLEKYHILE